MKEHVTPEHACFYPLARPFDGDLQDARLRARTPEGDLSQPGD